MKVIELHTSDVLNKIEEFKQSADEFSGVLMVALKKDGGQYMIGSTMSGAEQAFLAQFVAAWMNNNFKSIFCEHE